MPIRPRPSQQQGAFWFPITVLSCDRCYCFGGGVAGVAVGGLVVAGAIGSVVVRLRGQTKTITITTKITAAIKYQTRRSSKKFIATSLKDATDTTLASGGSATTLRAGPSA
jgi:hypothetical protein